MFFLIKFIILALFLVAFFFIPVGSKPLYDHFRAIGKTPPAQELRQDFMKNVNQLETWLRTHEALSGKTDVKSQSMPDGACMQDLPKQESTTNPPLQPNPDISMMPAPAPKRAPSTDGSPTSSKKTEIKKRKTVRRSGKSGGDTP